MIVTDAWYPQVNGVVTTFQNTIKELESRGYIVQVLHPGYFNTIPCPGYKEIRLSILPAARVDIHIRAFNPDYIHIATEGPLGLAARKVLKKKGERWSSSFHTKFAEYVESRIGFGANLVWKWLKHVYKNDSYVLTTTESMKSELIDRGFDGDKVITWSRGVDEDVFNIHPYKERCYPPIFMNVGRVSVEKNLEDFYKLDLPGKKYQVGDGPMLETYKAKYPEVEFLGAKFGSDLAHCYREADVMVFPSKSDTFGLVMIESMRCGTPVAAYPVTGPIDVIKNGQNGYMNDDLKQACLDCLEINPKTVVENSKQYTWKAATDRFVEALVRRSGQ